MARRQSVFGKDVNVVRKAIPCLLLLLLLLACAPAMAETYVFDGLYGSMEVPETYIVITPDNLTNYADWLAARGSSVEQATEDFAQRGVLLQAWSQEYDACFELRAVQNDRSAAIFDVNEQTSDVRGDYRTSHYPDNEYEGYEFSTSEWKNTAEGRFLVLRYICRDGGEVVSRGFMRRAIRNGYEIDFDMRIYGRQVTNKDNNNLNKIWESFHFVEVLPLPPRASAKINISDAPPTETNEQDFEIEGTAAKDVKLTAVTMGLSYPDPIVSEVTVGKSGKFSLPVRLPKEGVFLITITGEYQGEEVVELAYPVTYQRTLLTVNFTSQPSDTVMEDEVKIAGKGEPGATIQVFLNGEDVMTKRVTSAGKFSLALDVEEEGDYEAVLVFSKKGLADRRFTFKFYRKWSDQDMQDYLRKQAISPSYSQLIKKMEGYEGRIMGYKAYIADVSQSGDVYIIRMGLSRKNGEFTNIVLVTADEAPSFDVGERVMMYGTCAGMSLSTGVEGEEDTGESYPCFELLLLASLE